MLIKIKPDMFINTESISCFYKGKGINENRIFFANDTDNNEKVEDEFAEEFSKHLEEDEAFISLTTETKEIYINTKQIFKILLTEETNSISVSFNFDEYSFNFRFEDSKTLEKTLTKIQEKLSKSTYVDHF